jgi:hypothetical protein
VPNPDLLRPNTDDVAAKVLDGEAVMINLSNGFYYSMGNVGAFVWERIEAGYRLDDIANALTQRYDVSAERARADLEQLVAQLLRENLVVASNPESHPSQIASISNEPRLPYEQPKLEIYTDIGHLVALDPPMPGLKDLPGDISTYSSPR